MSSPQMTFLSSQDKTPSEQAESESGTSSSCSRSETVDLSEDFPLTKWAVKPTTSSNTVQCQIWTTQRRVQVRSGPTTASENVCVLSPGQRVKVVKTKTAKTKAGFTTTKAYVLSSEGQGWVSVNRQHKKTTETFVFKGQASASLKKLFQSASVWERHEAEVVKISNPTASTFMVRVTCPTWQQTEALRADLKNARICGRTLVNKRTPQLVNLKRVFGNSLPTVHVFDIDTDVENDHWEFLHSFDWSNQFKGSTTNFEHQVRDDLRALQFGGLRHVSWGTGHTSQGIFSMRDYCTLEFSKDAQLRNFIKNFEKYDFFQGASVKVDPIYANLETVSAESLKA